MPRAAAVGPHSPIGYTWWAGNPAGCDVAVGPHSPIGYTHRGPGIIHPKVAVGPHSPIGYTTAQDIEKEVWLRLAPIPPSATLRAARGQR